MGNLAAGLHRLKRRDAVKAGVVMADAFQHDPFWMKLFEGEDRSNAAPVVGKFYQASIKYCLTYGKAYATSERLEGVAAWVPGNLAHMTLWRQVRSGAFLTGMRAMIRGSRLGRDMSVMARLDKPVSAARTAHMGDRRFIYLMVLGVALRLQGQGFGGSLIRALIEDSEREAVPVYTETTIERSAKVYERYGFRVLDRVSLPAWDLPLWELVREP